jgi:hypothetical protein
MRIQCSRDITVPLRSTKYKNVSTNEQSVKIVAVDGNCLIFLLNFWLSFH